MPDPVAIVVPCVIIGMLVVWASMCGRFHDACFPQCRMCGRPAQFRTKVGWLCNEHFGASHD